MEKITWSEFGKQNIKHKKREPAERYKWQQQNGSLRASSLGRSGGREGKGMKACNCVSGI